MIVANINPDDNHCVVRISGQWDNLMNEYKVITDYFLENYFKEFMVAMDKWNEDAKSND